MASVGDAVVPDSWGVRGTEHGSKLLRAEQEERERKWRA